MTEGENKGHDGHASRKFQTTMAVLVATTVALFTGHITGDNFVDIIPMILFVYGAGNVAEYFAKRK